MEIVERTGIKIGVVCLLLALLAAALSHPQSAQATVVKCDVSGGDRSEQNRIDAVRLTATVDQTQEQIHLHWPAHNAASYSYNIYRKTRDGLDWGSPIATATSAETQYTDSSVSLGDAYEYRVERLGSGCTNQNGYIYVGLDAPLEDDKGTLLLIVEDKFETSLDAELDQFELDLRGDGWQVQRHFVGCFENVDGQNCNRSITRADAVAEVKTIVQNAYDAAPNDVKAVFLVGHVAIPYSGRHATDGHDRRAWPSDTYYGDIDGTWTDTWNNGSWMSNPNVAGDGVWDQATTTPSASGADTAPELLVGRVDMANMYFFEQSGESKADAELRLLKHYFEKNHKFRHGITRVRQRGLLWDRFGEGQGWEAPGVAQWTSLSTLVGSAESSDDTSGQTDGIYETYYHRNEYFNPDGYIFADVSGPSVTDQMFDSFGTIDYVPDSDDSDTDSPPVIFFNAFGSYFGDWDQWNNLLRAIIAMDDYGLAAVWGGWGTYTYHHMGLGEPIGNTVLATHMSTLSQSGGGDLYPTWYDATRPEMSVMGDPTLEMHIIDPPSNLTAQSRSAALSWTASPDGDVIGYHVYRAGAPTGDFVRLTSSPVSGTSFTDNSAETGTHTYMVRAIKLETTPSGTYYNASQGVFVTTDTISNPPQQTPFQPHTIPGTIEAEQFDNGGPNVAYFDLSNGDNGESGYRDTDVDMAEISSGNYKIGWTEDGEWLEYTTEAEAGTYRVDFSVASSVGNPGDIRLLIDGQAYGTVDVLSTGGWSAFETFSIENIVISASGTKVVRIEIVDSYIDIDNFTFVDTTSVPTAIELQSVADMRASNHVNLALVLIALTLLSAITIRPSIHRQLGKKPAQTG